MSFPKGVLVLATAGIVLSGCGHITPTPPASIDQVPLVPEAEVVARGHQCDRGANPFCYQELVVVDRAVASSGDLVTLEGRVLKKAGWSSANQASTTESGADSPGQKLHLTYATALADLTSYGVGSAKRSHGFVVALSRQVFARVPAMALILQPGPA